ncbi:MAG: glycosyltransferase family 2 protein [Anaerolineae bacterium]|nr:glycosyltransferase family 2 protein [Anaerolineae bacterium]
MRASVIIPVWNGAAVVEDCVESVFKSSGSELLEVICVDNASEDDSAARIAARFPQVRLLRQPMNLGFAGGVNVGIEAAQGDVFVLLNQDCVVETGWLAAFAAAFETHPEFGIAGCTIFNADGSVNHAGAQIRHPEGFSEHLTGTAEAPQAVDYVTGAVFAIRRQTRRMVGLLDEGYFPAYFEEADYCYRARRQGIETGYVPEARVTHLFSSHEAAVFPFRSAARQHKMRYRFVSKHFTDTELEAFFVAERDAVMEQRYLNEVFGRLMGARDTLQGLGDILERRRLDLDEPASLARQKLLREGFVRIARRALAEAQRLSLPHYEDWAAVNDDAKRLKQQEYELLRRIYFKAPDDTHPESRLHRFWRLLVLRPLSFLVGRDYYLLSQLNTVHVARLDAYQTALQAQQDQLLHCMQLFELFTAYEDH